MADTRERLRKDIEEAFEFARFVLKHPKMLEKIRDKADIKLIPAPSHRMTRSSLVAKKVQAFSSETVFHSL